MSYTLLAGAIYYFGTYFWVSIFIRDEDAREKWAAWGLVTLLLEIILLIGLIFYDLGHLSTLASFIMYHALVNVFGSVLNALRYLICLFLSSDENNHKSTLILAVLVLVLVLFKYIN